MGGVAESAILGSCLLRVTSKAQGLVIARIPEAAALPDRHDVVNLLRGMAADLAGRMLSQIAPGISGPLAGVAAPVAGRALCLDGLGALPPVLRTEPTTGQVAASVIAAGLQRLVGQSPVLLYFRQGQRLKCCTIPPMMKPTASSASPMINMCFLLPIRAKKKARGRSDGSAPMLFIGDRLVDSVPPLLGRHFADLCCYAELLTIRLRCQ